MICFFQELEAEVKEARNQAELQASLAVGDQDTEVKIMIYNVCRKFRMVESGEADI